VSTKSIPFDPTRQASSKAKRRRKKRRGKGRGKARPGFGSLPIGFGRFLGRPLSDVPAGYLRWALRTKTTPMSDRWAIGHYLRSFAPESSNTKGAAG